VPSTRVETMPSAPSRQACAKTVGPSSATRDARLGIAQQSRQRDLAVEERAIAQILTVVLEEIEGVQDRGGSSRPAAQVVESRQAVRPRHRHRL
jgi:hypothetical protein